LDDQWLRENVTLIQQSSVLFNDTFFMNVAFGSHDPLTVTREDVRAACETVLLQSTVASLPQGLDTNVGIGGHNLSGGQRQRVALARARLRDPPVLILDEVTSGLDPTSRGLILEAIRLWRAGKTTIIITHDVSQILDGDFVYALDQGFLVQHGFRRDLVRDERGMFRSLLSSAGVDSGLAGHSSPPPQSTASGPASAGNRGLFRLSLGADLERSKVIKPAEQRYDRAPQPARRSSLDMVQRSGEMTRSRRPAVGAPRRQEQDQRHERNKEKQAAGLGVGGDNLAIRKILATVWPVLDQRTRIRLGLGIAACTVAATCTPVFSFVFAQLLAAFWAPPAEMRAAGQTWAIRLAVIGAADGLATFCAFYLMQYAGQAWATSLRVEALKRILAQPRHWFDVPAHSPGRLALVLDRDAEEMRNLVGRFVPIVLIVATMMAGGLSWALVVSWRLTLVALASAPAVYAATRATGSVSGKWEARCDAMAEAPAAVSVETFVNIRVVRALGLEAHFSSKHGRYTDSTFRAGVQRGLWAGFFYGLNQAMPNWLTALVFWYAAVLLTSPGATVSASGIVQVINLLLFSIGTAAAMLDSIPQIAHTRAASGRVLHYATLSYTNSHERRGGVRLPTPFPVEMKALQFAYPAAHWTKSPARKVLRNVNLRIDRGDCLGIVGPSGCGKSTIANLLLRLYEPSEDHQRPLHASAAQQGPRPAGLSYAGVPASDVSTSSLRTHTAYVPQHPFLFPATVRENIVYGLHADSPYRDLSCVVEAAKLACIHDFVISLPQGYSTLVGEGGLGLSGGQAQRMSIARALVRKPKLLVLDEPTSSLDAAGAEGVRGAVQCLMRRSRQCEAEEGLTIVVITHSMEMMKTVSRLVAMDEGFVAEEGGFEELLARGGKFTALLNGGAWLSSD
jgi:ATP-binding cassette, subfamily B (MDR/TAP), member 1